MKKLFLTFILVTDWLLAGCASTSEKPTVVQLAPKSAEVIAVYKKGVGSISESQFKHLVDCPTAVGKVKAQWVWKEAVNAANICMSMHDYKHAEEIANALAEHEPVSPWGPFFLGQAALAQKHLERANWMCELALKRAPDVAVVHYLKGQILWAQKMYGPAVSSFEQALALDPSITPAHQILGLVYYRDQEYAKSKTHFDEVLSQDSHNTAVLTDIAENQLRENLPDDAISTYERLSKYNPKSTEYLERIAEIYESVMNNPSAALKTLKKIGERGILTAEMKSKMTELEMLTKQEKRSTASETKGDKLR